MQVEGKARPITRRRTLGILAGAAALLSSAKSFAAVAGVSRDIRAFTWRGTALGADATMTLCHHDRGEVEAAIDACLLEVERLEQEFSLYRNDSALSRLNRDGVLRRPSLDMVALMRSGWRLGEITGGHFDYTIQPLWSALAIRGRDIEAARRVIDYRRVDIAPDAIRLGKGQQITLNGIAQGYITDRVSELLVARGWSDVMVSLGETRALGGNADGAPWRIGLDGAGIDLDMTSGAVAVSSADGLALAEGSHLVDPLTGNGLSSGLSVAVRAPSATVADGLSTVLGFLPPEKWRIILREAHADEAWLSSTEAAITHIKASA